MTSLWRYEVNNDVLDIELFWWLCKDLYIITVIFCCLLCLDYFLYAYLWVSTDDVRTCQSLSWERRNAWKRETDIWFVFRILEFEVNFGDFICVTCILCVGMLEILNLQLGYKFGWASCML